LNEKDPAYDECGEICGKTGEPLNDYCQGCDMKEAQDDFKEVCIAELEKRLPAGEWKAYGFNALLRSVLDVLKFEGLAAENQTARVGKLVSALEYQRGRMRRIDDWNEKQKANKK
jgi:hypothetical protein